MSDSRVQPESPSVSYLCVQPDCPSVSSLSLLPESPSVSTLSDQHDSPSLSDYPVTSVVTPSVSRGWVAPTSVSLGMVSGHQTAQTCKD